MQVCEETRRLIAALRAGREEYADWQHRNYAEERSQFDVPLGQFDAPAGMRFLQEEIGGVPVEWMRLNDQEDLIVYLHGGGFVSGSVPSRREAFSRISGYAQMNGVSVAYRLAPEHPYPQGLMDCVRVYEGLLCRGYCPQRIHLFGESAGASLVLSLTHYLRDHQIPLPASICVFSPVVDLSVGPEDVLEGDAREVILSRNMYDEIQHQYCPGEDWRDPYISPIYGDFAGFPRTMIHAGTEEMLLADARTLHAVCMQAGVPCQLRIWEGLFHSFLVFPLPESDVAYREIADDYRKDRI